MRDLPTSRTLAWGVTVAACLLASSSALAFPWDIDMADSQAVRGYECWEYTADEDGVRVCIRAMQPLPDGVISQDHPFSSTAFKTRAPAKNDIAAWTALENPLQPTPQVLAKGETMFRTYCAPCHGVPDENGVIANLGTVAQPGRMAGVIALAGEGGVLSARTDGQVYRVIRMGNAIMPAYNWAMNDDEMWSIVHYSRTLEDGVYLPPKPDPVEDESGDEGDPQ